MKSVNRILAVTGLIILSCSLHAIDNTVICTPKNISVEQMIQPPRVPFDAKNFAFGLAEGFCLPFISIVIAFDKNNENLPGLLQEYRLFCKDYKQTADFLYGFRKVEQDAPQKLTQTLEEYESHRAAEIFTQAYTNLRKKLAAGNLHEIPEFAKICDEIVANRKYFPNAEYSIITEHNQHLTYLISRLNESAGLLIGSTMSTTACLYGLYHLIGHIPPQPKCTMICTQVCTPPAIDDLD